MRRSIENILIPLLLLFALWAPRAAGLDVFVTADENRWLNRSANFAFALVHHDWAGTFQREHPAVTTTWLGALGLVQLIPDFAQRSLVAPEIYGQQVETWLEPQTGISPITLLAAGRWWTVWAVVLALVSAYYPLKRLLGATPAAFAVLFVGWAPMGVGFTRQLQPDGFVAAAIFMSLAFLLGWLYGGRHWWELVISGIAMGLAWLTKTPAIALVPTGALLVGVEVWRSYRHKPSVQPSAEPGHSAMNAQSVVNSRSLIAGYIVWGAMASITFFVLWPVMWVDPINTFQRMYLEMVVYTGGHQNSNYFLGQIAENPGPVFYPVVYFFRTTPATLIGLVVAFLAYWRNIEIFSRQSVRQTAAGIGLFAFVFLLLMTVVGKKFDRYLLPVFLVLDILAALGWVVLAQLAGKAIQRYSKRSSTVAVSAGTGASTWRRVAAGGSLVLALGPLHGLFTMQHYPYYMTYFNPLAGGNRSAPEAVFVGWGEGLEQVADWLNRQPDADLLHVLSWYAGGPLSYFFEGTVVGPTSGSRMPWIDVDYVVLYINQVQRKIPTTAAVDYFLRETPVHTVTLQGMTMARIYNLNDIVANLTSSASPLVDRAVTGIWPDLKLRTLRIPIATGIGTGLPIEMDWSVQIERNLKVSTRLFSVDGTLVAQQDVPLADTVNITLFVPPDAVPGSYTVQMLVYEDETLEPFLTVDGRDLIIMAPVEVTVPD